MARHEADREDLFAEAVGLRPRAELRWGERTLVAGLRTDDVLVLYFAPDEMLQVDRHARLRRAYWHGELYRTQGTALARLIRKRTAEHTWLQRTDLAPHDYATLGSMWLSSWTAWMQAWQQQCVQIVRAEPPEDVTRLLAELMRRGAVASSHGLLLAPALPTRRR
ncbi:MAG: hypothetical protein KatS3mg114_1321 [Planctomycetaceae bacterium]|nr:MAG: hypothetical protein KatS3mg114_1321 [Planctomycetaceae bacterium]